MQQHRDKMHLLANYSTKLDTAAQGFSPCMQMIAAASYVVQVTGQIVMPSPLVLRVLHCVSSILLKAKIQHLAAVTAMKYDLVLIQAANIVIEQCPALNQVSLIPTEEEWEEHNCEEVMTQTATSRTDPFRRWVVDEGNGRVTLIRILGMFRVCKY